jgi:hypothetical protein
VIWRRIDRELLFCYCEQAIHQKGILRHILLLLLDILNKVFLPLKIMLLLRHSREEMASGKAGELIFSVLNEYG